MNDRDGEQEADRLFERAASALRTPVARDEPARERLVHLVHVEAAGRWAGRVMRLPWWAAVAAAAVAFAVGLSTGRLSSSSRAGAMRIASAAPAASSTVQFVFVSPSATNVSLVGDFNGWNAAATPMKRADGKTTWSVAVPLPPGVHVYAFIVDGVTWVVDPQAPLSAEQSFGQRKSVVVVPGEQRS